MQIFYCAYFTYHTCSLQSLAAPPDREHPLQQENPHRKVATGVVNRFYYNYFYLFFNIN